MWEDQRVGDLVYRLRNPAWSWAHGTGSNLDKEETVRDMADAADEIERLRKALEPFAKLAEFVADNHRDSRPIIHGLCISLAERLTIGDLRSAQSAMSPANQAPIENKGSSQ
jgi:hypothetical protein